MNELTKYKIRTLSSLDQSFLWEMLYQSLYIPEGSVSLEREIINQPDISKYVIEWGKEDDFGFVAVDESDHPVGAIWLRLLKGEERGYGYVDDKTPEMGMAVLAEHRNKGIGTMLLSHLLESPNHIYEYISLSVASENPALHLYQRFGFEVVREYGDSIVMKRKLNEKKQVAI
jgi:ribosomal protein S18 acetylase RimI-like enzyme